MSMFWKKNKSKTPELDPIQMAERTAYLEGKRVGYENGYEEGFTAGKAQGYNEGIAEAKQAALRALKQKGQHHDPVSKL